MTLRQRLEQAALRLEMLAIRSSPMIASEIKREVVAVREASRMLEDQHCEACKGSGETSRGVCSQCAGSGAL